MIQETYSIIVCDDDYSIRENLIDYLEEHNYQVHAAENGTVALEKLKQYPSHSILLLDLLMPHCTGLEVLDILKKEKKDIPTIVISGVGDLSMAIQALKSGANDYLIKPILDMEIVHLSIQRLIREEEIKKENENYKRNLEKLVIDRTKELDEANITLRGILGRVEEERSRVKEDIALNIENDLKPTLTQLHAQSRIEANDYQLLLHKLEHLSSDFYKKMVNLKYNLTPTEIEICNLVKQGHSSKKIADLLYVSESTISTHKKNIRKKLKLTNTSANLQNHLMQIEETKT